MQNTRNLMETIHVGLENTPTISRKHYLWVGKMTPQFHGNVGWENDSTISRKHYMMGKQTYNLMVTLHAGWENKPIQCGLGKNPLHVLQDYWEPWQRLVSIRSWGRKFPPNPVTKCHLRGDYCRAPCSPLQAQMPAGLVLQSHSYREAFWDMSQSGSEGHAGI